MDASLDIRTQEAKKVRLQAEIEQAKYIEDLKNIYLASQASVQMMSDTDALTFSEAEQLNDLILALERALPKRSMVRSMAINGENLNMSMTTVTKEESAKVLMQLKSIPYIESVSIGGIVETLDEATQRTEVSFSVNCVLKKYEPEQETVTGEEE